jgi:hypothetical protein
LEPNLVDLHQDGKITTTYQKNNQQLQVTHEFWMDAYTISLMVSTEKVINHLFQKLSPTKRIQIMKSSYCTNG